MTDTKAALDALRRAKKYIGREMLAATLDEIEKAEQSLTTPPAPTVMGDDVREAIRKIRTEMGYSDDAVETLIRAPDAELVKALEAAERYIIHCGNNNTERGESHPQQLLLDCISKALANHKAAALKKHPLMDDVQNAIKRIQARFDDDGMRYDNPKEFKSDIETVLSTLETLNVYANDRDKAIDSLLNGNLAPDVVDVEEFETFMAETLCKMPRNVCVEDLGSVPTNAIKKAYPNGVKIVDKL